MPSTTGICRSSGTANPENCWFTLSYSPIRDESGGVGGLLAVVAETTGRVDGERRLATLGGLAKAAATVSSDVQACADAAAVFEQNPIDVPFALFYLTSPDGLTARLVAATGIAPTIRRRPSLAIDPGEHAWPCRPRSRSATGARTDLVSASASRSLAVRIPNRRTRR